MPRSVVGSVTRMADDVVQSEGTHDQFRGIDNICLIPFNQEPTRTTPKLSSIINLSPVHALEKPGEVNYKVYTSQFVPVGTKNFLFYGKAIDDVNGAPLTDMEDKFNYGVLKAKGLTDAEFTSPNDIMFSLEQINTSTAAQASDPAGQAIVNLLNELATISVNDVDAPHNKWSTTTNEVLSRLYKNFIGLTTSSSASAAVVLGQLHYGLEHVLKTDPARTLADAIKAKIEGACTTAPQEGFPASLQSTYLGYPENLGLPDGAVRIRWNSTSNKFVDVTANYTKNMKLKITDYLYPAALWYHVNTPI